MPDGVGARPDGPVDGPADGTVDGTDFATSAVVLTHRMDRYPQLLACLDSLARQTRPPRETVIVVDGCAEVAAALERRGGPEKVVALPVNRGLSAARNVGVAHVTSPWVAFLDDDAVAEPTWLEELIRGCRDWRSAGAGGWSAPDFSDGVTPAWFPEELLWTVGCSYEGMPRTSGLVRNVFGGCALLRRDLFELVGGFDENLGRRAVGFGGGEEADFCLRVSVADPGARFAHAPRAVIRHRVPADRSSLRYVLARCFSDGASKARIERSNGRRTLSSEQRFVLAVPRGVWRHLRAGRPLAAAVLVLGVLTVAAGYLRGRLGGSPAPVAVAPDTVAPVAVAPDIVERA